MIPLDARILVADDDPLNREMLSLALAKEGCEVTAVEDGMRAVRLLRADASTFDLLLLDVMMPLMDGYDVLRYVKSEPELARLPVIIISALDDISSVVKCLELGADDYVTKPFDPVLLHARINSSLTRKRHADTERLYMQLLEQEEKRADRLLLNILPMHIADRLKAGETHIADQVNDASVIFADLVGFTTYAAQRSPDEVVSLLNDIMSSFDELTIVHRLEKIKTIGDAYLAAGGLIEGLNDDHLASTVEMAFDMLRSVEHLGDGIELRVGIHAGPVVAGVIGSHKFSYDLWGDTVNVASRMESHGEPGHVHVTQNVRDRLVDRFDFEDRGPIEIKNRGALNTYLVAQRHAVGAPAEASTTKTPSDQWVSPDELIQRP